MSDAKRWQIIKDILYPAMELEPAEREAFLDSECGSDQELRREIVSLLASSDKAGLVLKRPRFT